MIGIENALPTSFTLDNLDRKKFRTPVKVERFEQFDQIDLKFIKEWNGLLAESECTNIFLTYEWLRSWWHSYGDNKTLCIITARDVDGMLIGIAPLYLHRSRYYKIPVTEVTFIGDKASDRQSFIVHKDHLEVYGILLSEITTNVAYDIIRLEQVPAGSPLIVNFKMLPNCESEIETTLPYIKISSDWDEFNKGLSNKFKRDLKHKYNVLKRTGPWKIKCITDAEEISRHLNQIAKIEIESFKGQREYALFADQNALSLHREFLHLSRTHQWGALFLLYSNDAIISYLLAFVFNGTLCAYNMAYTPEYRRMSPGKLVLNEAIKYAFDNGLAEFDFLRGNTHIKTLWCNKARHNYRIVCFNSSFKTRILRCFVFYIRPFLKSLIGHMSEKRIFGFLHR